MSMQISMIFLLAALVTVIVLFIYLTLFDPVDDRVKEESQSHERLEATSKEFTQKFCEHCKCNVNLASKHCAVCDRCCFEFDHHCRFLNNCIGSKNYK